MGARSHKTKEANRNPKANASPLQEAPSSENVKSLRPPIDKLNSIAGAQDILFLRSKATDQN